MDPKVTLYDADNVKIGETYTRRARQLVKQQRAFWLDDGQVAVQFYPGAEHLKDMESEAVPPEPAELSPTEKKLMKLAKSRVFFAQFMRMMFVIYFVVNAFLVGIWLFTDTGYFWPGWVIGGWGTGLLVLRTVIKTVVVPPPSTDRRIAMEYRMLRSALPDDADV